jgi:hypothetical protein
MQITELLTHLKTAVAGEGDFVTEKTIVAHDDLHLIVQPPNFPHAYRLKLTDAFVEVGKFLYWANDVIGDDIEAVFKAEILERWDWDKVIENAQSEPQEGDDGETYGTSYLGSILSLTPSGKVYMPYASSNTYAEEANVDQCWQAALSAVAEAKGGWIQGSEGDGCDILFGMAIESEEPEGQQPRSKDTGLQAQA